MNEPIAYDSPGALADYLSKQGLNMSKRFGQNFLVSRSAREQIVSALLEEEDPGSVWEIGPGLGAMTALLVSRELPVTVFEIDHGFCSALRDFYASEDNFTLIEGDFLKTWWNVWAQEGTPCRIMGNLPYNAGSVMIGALIESVCLPERMVFTLQKEVALRMTSSPGQPHYSSFSLLCSMDYRTKIIGDLKPGNFFPRPEIVSSIIVMDRIPSRVGGHLRNSFLEVVHDLFRSRRKNLRNALRMGSTGQKLGKERVDEVIRSSGYNQGIRGEALSLEEIVRLTECIEREIN